MTDYNELNSRLLALTDGVRHATANLANAAALLFGGIENINWAGFYLLCGKTLVLAPFQGKPACIEIAEGRGVCGLAVKTGRTVVVDDVTRFKGHIACDSASRSEIVIPLTVGGEIVGVMDIDSALFGRFSDDDRKGLEEFARILCRALESTDIKR